MSADKGLESCSTCQGSDCPGAPRFKGVCPRSVVAEQLHTGKACADCIRIQKERDHYREQWIAVCAERYDKACRRCGTAYYPAEPKCSCPQRSEAAQSAEVCPYGKASCDDAERALIAQRDCFRKALESIHRDDRRAHKIASDALWAGDNPAERASADAKHDEACPCCELNGEMNVACVGYEKEIAILRENLAAAREALQRRERDRPKGDVHGESGSEASEADASGGGTSGSDRAHQGEALGRQGGLRTGAGGAAVESGSVEGASGTARAGVAAGPNASATAECPECNGEGSYHEGFQPVETTCKVCKGTGRVEAPSSTMAARTPCATPYEKGIASLVEIAACGGASSDATGILEQTLVAFVHAVRRETIEACAKAVGGVEIGRRQGHDVYRACRDAIEMLKAGGT